MKILIGTQASSRGEIVYLGHGPSEAAARRCFREWLNKGLNPNDEEAAGGRLLDSSKCTERLFAALTAPKPKVQRRMRYMPSTGPAGACISTSQVCSMPATSAAKSLK